MEKLSTPKPLSKSEQKELEKLCAPLVKYIQKKWHPHTRIIIEWDRASLSQEALGLPFPIPD